MARNRLFPLRRDLGLQMLAAYLVFVAFVALAVFAFERFATHRLEVDLKAADLALARAIAQETNTTMDSALQAVRQLAQEEAVRQADPFGMGVLFSTLMKVRGDVNLVYRLDRDGTMAYHYPTGPESTVGIDFSFRDYFQRARATRNPVFSKGRISPTTEQPVATAVMPIWSDGRFDGVVATNIKLQSLSHALAAIVKDYQADEELQLAILDASGQVVAHPDPAMLLQDASQGSPQLIQAVLSGQSGAEVAQMPGDEERLYSYVPIYSVGWGVIVSRPTAVAFASLREFQRGALIAVVLFLFGGLVFWLALSRRVMLPLERLAIFSQSVGEEEFSESQRSEVGDLARRPDQIGYLTHSLVDMHEAIEARLAELATLLQTSGEVVSSLDSATILDRILEQVERLMDVQMCAIFAFDQSKGLFRVQASRGLPPWYQERAVIDPNEPGSVTMRSIRSRQPIQVSDTESNPSFRAHRKRAEVAGYRSVLAAPLLAQHAPPAALLVFRPETHVFTKKEINLLSSFANHAAMAIENATLYARSDMRLQEEKRRLDALVQSMQDGLILEDLHGRVLYANRRIESLCGVPLEEISGGSVNSLMELLVGRARDPETARTAIAQAVARQDNRWAEFALIVDGRLRQMRLRLFDVTDSRGTPIGRGRILQDVTQRYQLDRMKSSLISTVSHELRTPLAAIKGYTSTLLADDVQWDLKSQREFLEVISVETDHLTDLVSDLLDMSRIEAGNLTVSRSACELGELIEQAAQHCHLLSNGRLRVSLPSGLPALYVDPRRIEAVLRNLMENAAKYSPAGTPVRVSAAVNDHRLVVRVEDEGPGIPPEHSRRIFDSFYRVQDGLARNTPGAGLGLAISQGFVRAHGGDIWLEERPIGTCVAFSLPLTQPNGGPGEPDRPAAGAAEAASSGTV